MPKWQNIKSGSWSKELLLTFIGTTLSIVLTFGTAHFIEQKQQAHDGRQAAIMVIHDIENSAQVFEKSAQEEESLFNLAQDVMDNIDNPESVNTDTLISFINYIITAGERQFYYDDSSERVFLSSQDIWKNINNATFIDAVQDFYHERNILYENLNQMQFVQKPISEEEYYNAVDDVELYETKLRAFVKDVAKRENVRFYVNYSFQRQRYFNNIAESFRSLANKCKFIMGITDEELENYVKNIQRTGKQLKDRHLIGKWKYQSSADMIVEREFFRDHTYSTIIINHVTYPFYTGRVELKYYMHGTWELQGDSLITVNIQAFDYEIDKSGIKYSPSMEETVNKTLETWENSIIENKQSIESRGEQRNAMYASIDAAGKKIELRHVENDADGEKKEEKVNYMTRMNN